ncbi:hypothetical protein N7451_011693 [Penicillium sp. IBT 35674x]|nr:hypothetical protein N7451_011693 [Penicillium sp. IBT 35674x]
MALGHSYSSMRPDIVSKCYLLELTSLTRWPHAETVKCIERSGWARVILYGKGTAADQDDLERKLTDGERIQAVVLRASQQPTAHVARLTPNSATRRRLRVCGSMRRDVKAPPGASDVMSGSVIVDPQSGFNEAIHARLNATWEDVLFPGDVSVLTANCPDFVERVQYCSRSALIVATFLSKHHSVVTVNYPVLVPTRHLYERYRRQNGGYGYVLGIIFHDPDSAVAFYDTLDVCKGASIGANFTLAIPYARLATFGTWTWPRQTELHDTSSVSVSVWMIRRNYWIE